MLRKEKIPHQVLNAKFHEKEAEIIAQAGKYKSVTIATNMAGRGTDIMLGGNLEYTVKEKLAKKDILVMLLKWLLLQYLITMMKLQKHKKK